MTLSLIQKYLQPVGNTKGHTQRGGTGRDIEARIKVYKSHRRVFGSP